MKPIINYKEHCKVRIRNSDPSFDKHECIKLLICLLYKRKHKNAGIYTEHTLPNGEIVDVYIDLGKEQIYYEIQSNLSRTWLEHIKNRDIQLNINTLIVPVNKISENLNQMINELNAYIV